MNRLLMLGLLLVAGFVAISWAWLGSSPETIVAQQVAWVCSAGLTGAALVVHGSALVAIYSRRRNAAAELAALTEATEHARELLGMRQPA
jgi:hypothetical protein